MEEEAEDPRLEIRPSVSNHTSSTDDEKYGATNTNSAKPSSPTEMRVLKKQVVDLTTLISEKDFKYHQLSQRLNDLEDEAHRQRRLNDSLTNKVRQLRDEITSNAEEYEEELTKLEQEKQNKFLQLREEIISNAEEYEEELTKLEQEKQKEQDNYVKDLVEMKNEITSLKDSINVKEELIIPSLVHQIESKNTILDRTQESLTSTVEKVDELRREVDVLKEERDALTSELRNTICDTGNSSNEMYEVLRLRDKMAKDFVAYRFGTEETINVLKESIRQKDDLIDKLLSKIESLKPSRVSISLTDSGNYDSSYNWDWVTSSARARESWRKPLLVVGGVVVLSVIVGCCH